jgi:cytoskeletal protein CcmA (bactofilin family)
MGLFGKKKKQKTVVTALIGNSTHIDSNFLSFTGGIHIHGHVGLDVVGSEDTGTAVNISEDGEVDGDVRAVDVFIAGIVHGNVFASGHLQLMPGHCRRRGCARHCAQDLRYRLLRILFF